MTAVDILTAVCVVCMIGLFFFVAGAIVVIAWKEMERRKGLK